MRTNQPEPCDWGFQQEAIEKSKETTTRANNTEMKRLPCKVWNPWISEPISLPEEPSPSILLHSIRSPSSRESKHTAEEALESEVHVLNEKVESVLSGPIFRRGRRRRKLIKYAEFCWSPELFMKYYYFFFWSNLWNALSVSY